jgi:hypothetical protein
METVVATRTTAAEAAVLVMDRLQPRGVCVPCTSIVKSSRFADTRICAYLRECQQAAISFRREVRSGECHMMVRAVDPGAARIRTATRHRFCHLGNDILTCLEIALVANPSGYAAHRHILSRPASMLRTSYVVGGESA